MPLKRVTSKFHRNPFRDFGPTRGSKFGILC